MPFYQSKKLLKFALLTVVSIFTGLFSITTRLNDAIERTTLASLNGASNQIKDSMERTFNSPAVSQVTTFVL